MHNYFKETPAEKELYDIFKIPKRDRETNKLIDEDSRWCSFCKTFNHADIIESLPTPQDLRERGFTSRKREVA